MIKKLFKYDFISINKDLIILYILCFILSFVVLLCNNSSNDMVIAAKKISTDLSLVGMFLIIIIPFMKCFLRVRNTLYKEESYLYLTLPVKRGTLFTSKTLVTLISLLVSWIVLGICFINVFSGKNVFMFINEILDNYTGISNNLLFVITLTVQFSLIYMSLILGLVLGNKQETRKDLFTLLYGIAIYFITRLLIGNIYELKNNIISILIVLLSDIILFVIARYIFKKGVNID